MKIPTAALGLWLVLLATSYTAVPTKNPVRLILQRLTSLGKIVQPEEATVAPRRETHVSILSDVIESLKKRCHRVPEDNPFPDGCATNRPALR